MVARLAATTMRIATFTIAHIQASVLELIIILISLSALPLAKHLLIAHTITIARSTIAQILKRVLGHSSSSAILLALVVAIIPVIAA